MTSYIGISMKAIEQAAKSANSYGYPNYTGANNEAFDSGFKAGVEFVQRWIPVEEELPKDGTIILVRSNSPYKPSTAFYTKNVFRCDFIGISHGQVTHWRPIEYK